MLFLVENNIEAMRLRHKAEIKRLQENCNHKTTKTTTISRQERERIFQLLVDTEDTCLGAVEHVGYANYKEREDEARGWIEDAFEKLRQAI